MNQKENQSSKQKQKRFVFIGDLRVGKTNLISRISDDLYTQNYFPTIGVDFKVKIIGDTKYLLWDTSGDLKYRTVITTYYKAADMILLTYSIDDINSFNHLKDWYKDVISITKQGVYFCVIGNKSDLRDDRKVTEQMGNEFAKSIGAFFMETSCINQVDISNIIQYMEHFELKKQIALIKLKNFNQPKSINNCI